MIELVVAQPGNKQLLWNVFQKYLYEMSSYYDDDMDEKGNYQYRYFDAYFTEPERKALLIYHDKTFVGFAMVNPYSFINENPDYVLAEFTIFPRYRKNHIASKAAEAIFHQYRGSWELKYNENNIAAKGLWKKSTASYNPKANHHSHDETVLSFSTM